MSQNFIQDGKILGLIKETELTEDRMQVIYYEKVDEAKVNLH